MLESPPDRPLVVMYTAQDLPLFRDGMAPLHALPESILRRPCWLHAQDAPIPEGEIFAHLPEGPVDATHHPHFWAMLEDVHIMMAHHDGFRRALLAREGHGKIRSGYHVDASYESVRGYFARYGHVVDADALVRAYADDGRLPPGESLARVDRVLRVTPRSSAARAALHDYLHGGGSVPPPMTRNAPVLAAVFGDASAASLDEVQLRALDVVAQDPMHVRKVEEALAWGDPVVDRHYRWRELLLARGVDEDDIESSAVHAWIHGDVVTTRAWWILARAARDPGAFLTRYEGLVRTDLLHRRLLFSAWITWELPLFRGLAEALVSQHGDRLVTDAYLSVLRSTQFERTAKLVTDNLARVLKKRTKAEARQIRDALARVDTAT